MASTVDFTRPAGTIVQVGMSASPAKLAGVSVLVKELNWVGSFRFIGEFITARRWLEDGRVDPRPLIGAGSRPSKLKRADFAPRTKCLC